MNKPTLKIKSGTIENGLLRIDQKSAMKHRDTYGELPCIICGPTACEFFKGPTKGEFKQVYADFGWTIRLETCEYVLDFEKLVIDDEPIIFTDKREI